MFLFLDMQILISSFLLIQCLLVLSVFGECPQVRECMACRGNAECVVSADNKRVECTPANTTDCQPQTCNTPFYTCMATWARANVNNSWFMISRCLSAGTADPCDTGPICKHQFSSALPDTVASGSFFCECYGNFCNQNFLADITSDLNETSAVATVTMDPTPTMPPTERDCISCSNVSANCTLSGDKRSLQCFIDNECVNNVIRCTNRAEVCGVSWSRQTSSSPWSAFAMCVTGGQTPTCEGTIIRQPIPGSVEQGSFFCTCQGALCNREFGVVLPDPVPVSSTISMPPTSTDTDVRNTTTSTMAPTSTIIPNSTTTGNTVESEAVNIRTDGKFVFCAKQCCG